MCSLERFSLPTLACFAITGEFVPTPFKSHEVYAAHFIFFKWERIILLIWNLLLKITSQFFSCVQHIFHKWAQPYYLTVKAWLGLRGLMAQKQIAMTWHRFFSSCFCHQEWGILQTRRSVTSSLNSVVLHFTSTQKLSYYFSEPCRSSMQIFIYFFDFVLRSCHFCWRPSLRFIIN